MIHAGPRLWHVADAQERLGVDAHVVPVPVGALTHFIHAEVVVPRWHRRMCGKHTAVAYALHCLRERQPLLAQLAHALHHHERGVSFIGVPRGGGDTEGAQRAHTADAQQPLLAQAHRRPTRVQLRQQGPVVGMVFRQVGIEQIHRHATHLHLPDADVDVAPEGVHRDEVLLAVLAGQRHDGHRIEVDGIVRVLLPAVHADVLIEVALPVQNAHGHERDPEIGCRLEVVTGEYAETTGVDRHGVVHPELGAEVRDRLSAQFGKGAGVPGVLVRALRGQPPHGAVVARTEDGIVGELHQTGRIDELKQPDRVVAQPMPEALVDLLEEHPRVAIPTPREIVREVGELGEPCRQRGRVRSRRGGWRFHWCGHIDGGTREHER